MKTKRKWRIGAAVVTCLALAGCEKSAHKPTELSEQMQQEMKIVTPTVGGPSEEFSTERKPDDVVPVVEDALKNSGIEVVRTTNTGHGQWLLGQSLADRKVLVQILPIYPGRSTIKVTVEGGDAVARDLLKHLAGEIMQKTR